MEKDIGKIRKNDFTDIVVRIDDFGGKIGLTIREFSRGERYTGFTKSGTRIPAESFQEFKELINSIDEEDLKAAQEAEGMQEKEAKETSESEEESEEESEQETL